MPTLAESSAALQNRVQQADGAAELSRLEARLPPLLSIIAGMVDLTGFFTLGNIFTAHVTGNLVVAAADAVHGGPFHLTQALAIPVFMLALAAVWLIAQVSQRHGPSLARLLRARLALLLQHFSKLEDTREPWRIVYPLKEVLLLVTCATIASCDDFDDIVAWGKHHLHFLRRSRNSITASRASAGYVA